MAGVGHLLRDGARLRDTLLRDGVGRLRVPWRVLSFWLLMLAPIVAWAIGVRLLAAGLGTTARELFPEDAPRTLLLTSALMLAAALLATYVMVRRAEGRGVGGAGVGGPADRIRIGERAADGAAAGAQWPASGRRITRRPMWRERRPGSQAAGDA